ncbi:MAG TPA: DUF72 domain-containing protein [Armatimonadota bacterium]|nr:DUF72 domain-containing protein [Armatimonadota bacterium]
MGEIRIGTSGFSYDDWRGFFYPKDIQKGDMLGYYAERFSAVEVNSSFYAILSASAFARMAEKTPKSFEFVVKAYKDLTHAPDVDLSAFEPFVSVLAPLVEVGKLGCVLAQYPWSFKREKKNFDRLRQLREQFGELPVVVEFRNAGWVGEETFDFLREHSLGFCCVDEPRLRGLMPPVAVATCPVGYVRFHGRNVEKWWQHEEAWQRYDYLYSSSELSEWIPKVRELASATEKTYLFFNNHYQGKSAQNAQMFAGMLRLMEVQGDEADLPPS